MSHRLEPLNVRETPLMDWLTAPVGFVLSIATALLFGFLVQRMLGLRLGPIRLLLGGVFALLVYQPILFSIANSVADVDPSDGRLGWFVLLAMMCTILAAMLFLVVGEAGSCCTVAQR